METINDAENNILKLRKHANMDNKQKIWLEV